MFIRKITRVALIAGGLGGAATLVAVAHAAESKQSFAAAAEQAFHRASYNAVPKDYVGPTFKANYNFPTSAPAQKFPWEDIDFHTEPEKYLKVVLAYCFENNINSDGEFNTSMQGSTRWFHAPWMAYLPTGREPINGLTMERPTPAFELNKNQKHATQTWAIAFYNEHGAIPFGKIWKNKADPDFSNVRFPVGSVTFKLLFSEASDQQVPWLKGSPEIYATIRDDPLSDPTTDKNADLGRHLTTVRLVQIDVAIRDKRAETEGGIGWIFGTFVYDGNNTAIKDPWARVIPVGLQWGNDPSLTIADWKAGNSKLKQGWINEKAKNLIVSEGAHRPFLGWAGRLNGPVDNFRSSCASCHSSAQWPMAPSGSGDFSAEDGGPYNAPKDLPPTKQQLYFRNVNCGEVFEPSKDEKVHSLDYSLQAQIGLDSFFKWRQAQYPEVAEAASSTDRNVFQQLLIAIGLAPPPPGRCMRAHILNTKDVPPPASKGFHAPDYHQK